MRAGNLIRLHRLMRAIARIRENAERAEQNGHEVRIERALLAQLDAAIQLDMEETYLRSELASILGWSLRALSSIASVGKGKKAVHLVADIVAFETTIPALEPGHEEESEIDEDESDVDADEQEFDDDDYEDSRESAREALTLARR